MSVLKGPDALRQMGQCLGIQQFLILSGELRLRPQMYEERSEACHVLIAARGERRHQPSLGGHSQR